MGLIKITSAMSETERIAAYNSNMQYLEKDLPLELLPVGIIISFDTDVDPNELYGGTWIRIKGRFIYGVGDGETAGALGGEREHLLTESEIPSHTHYYNSYQFGFPAQYEGKDNYKTPVHSYSGVMDNTDGTQTNSTGGSQPHNNMPPYYGANTWRRIL